MKSCLYILALCLSLTFTAQARFNMDGKSKVSLEVFPNPSTEYVVVKLPASQKGEVEITIRSMIGNEVKQTPVKIQTNTYRIRTADFNEGYYYLIVEGSGNYKETYRFLKK